MVSGKSNSPIPVAFLFVLAGIMLVFYLVRISRNEFVAQLAMESDAMAIVNYYVPQRIELDSVVVESNVKLPTFQSAHPLFGVLVLGDSKDSFVTIALDEAPDKSFSYIYIDKNNNEDLTDDGEPVWDEDKGSYWLKEVLVDVDYLDAPTNAPVPYPVSLYHFKNRLSHLVVAYRNGYREGEIALKDTTYKIALLDDDLDGLFNDFDNGALIIDVNKDGVLDGNPDSPEFYALGQPINVNGRTYDIQHISPAGNLIAFSLADSSVRAKPNLTLGQPAPLFHGRTMDGRTIDLDALKGKTVLLDFWATWNKPWNENLKSLKDTYYRFHAQGFEIIGINLDYDLKKLPPFLNENNIAWPQIANGQGWDLALAKLFNVESLPKNYLLDRNGVIRYKNLTGRNLYLKVRELVNEPIVSGLGY